VTRAVTVTVFAPRVVSIEAWSICRDATNGAVLSPTLVTVRCRLEVPATLLPGEAVPIDVRAANHDPTRFADAACMDLTRDPAGHLALGAGIHFCLGAALARMEAAEALTALFRRFPSLALTDAPIHWRPSKALHALQDLPVRA
jgi:cytochrome P450